VASGTSTATQFEIILTSTQLEIDGYINEADISKVKAGQPVTFTVDTYPGQTFTGKIASLSPNATTVSSVQEYEAHISIDDYGKLKSGLPATISVITASANNVILVPQSALTYSHTYLESLAGSGEGMRFQIGSGQAANKGSSGSQGGPMIFHSQGGQTPSPGNSQTGALSSQSGANPSQSVGLVVVLVNGKPQIGMVTTGLSDDVNVEITSGLKAGDIVATSSSIPAKTSGSTSNSGQKSNTMSPAERATLGLPGGGG
jgi:HlyD family secretion protein